MAPIKEDSAVSCIGIEFTGKSMDELKKKAEDYFLANATREGIFIKTDACGCTRQYKTMQQFTGGNKECLCKDPRHYSVKLTLEF